MDAFNNKLFFGNDLPPEITKLIISFFGDDIATLKALSEVSHKGRDVTRDILKQAKIAAILIYGVAILHNKPNIRYGSFLDEILGGPKRWRTSFDAQIVVARTFGGFRVRDMVVHKDGPYTEEDYKSTYKHAYPFHWQSIEAFKKVHDWWHWVCHNKLQVALRVHLLSGFLLAGEAFLEGEENGNFNLRWESSDYPLGYDVRVYFNDDEDDYGDRVILNIDNGAYVTRIEYGITFGEDLKFEFHPEPRAIGWNGERVGPFPTRVDFSRAPTKETVNKWALDLITTIETELGADKLYNTMLMGKLDNSKEYVESLHIGRKHLAESVRGDEYFEDLHSDSGVENEDDLNIII